MAAHQTFAEWLHDTVVAAGYDLSTPRAGGKTKLAADAGIATSQVHRALSGDALPDIRTQRLLAKALGVPPREMYIRSGLLVPEDLEVDPTALADLDARQLGLKLGVAPDHLAQFEQIVRAVAETFEADDKRAAKGRTSD